MRVVGGGSFAGKAAASVAKGSFDPRPIKTLLDRTGARRLDPAERHTKHTDGSSQPNTPKTTHTTPNTFKMREAVSLHMGQSGIQTGNACWELCACPQPPPLVKIPLGLFGKRYGGGFS